MTPSRGGSPDPPRASARGSHVSRLREQSAMFTRLAHVSRLREQSAMFTRLAHVSRLREQSAMFTRLAHVSRLREQSAMFTRLARLTRRSNLEPHRRVARRRLVIRQREVLGFQVHLRPARDAADRGPGVQFLQGDDHLDVATRAGERYKHVHASLHNRPPSQDMLPVLYRALLPCRHSKIFFLPCRSRLCSAGACPPRTNSAGPCAPRGPLSAAWAARGINLGRLRRPPRYAWHVDQARGLACHAEVRPPCWRTKAGAPRCLGAGDKPPSFFPLPSWERVG